MSQHPLVVVEAERDELRAQIARRNETVESERDLSEHLRERLVATTIRERALRSAIIDALCASPSDAVGGLLRQGLNAACEPGAHPEDRCEECFDKFKHWDASSEDWERVTGRDWGGPIICRPCFDNRLAATQERAG